MVRIAVVEDEDSYRTQICDYLSRYESENQVRLSVTLYQDGINLLDEYTGQFDVIFMDIQMRLMNGLETAQKIRKQDRNVILIFVTNLAHHATDGYDVDAKGFVIKPISYLALARQMDRAIDELSRKQEQFLLLENARQMQRFNLQDVYYIESVGHYLHIHAKNGVYTAHLPIKKVEEQLENRHFFKCNSGILVNLRYVEAINQSGALVCGQYLPVSRSRKKEFMLAMSRSLGGDRLC